ncbi:MAG: DM13 domain-containing protein [Nitriliruptorales bacterium]|nr:DM13 domain-containing protein [Nitriliruptorales bacterium]
MATAVTAVAALGVGAYLFFGVFGFHLLFVDEVVEEADPFAAGPGASGLEGDEMPEELATSMNDAMSEDDVPMEEMVDEPMPSAMPEEPTTLATGTFQDRSHPTTGTVRVVTDGARRVLRIEDLRTDNGPDLNVYLVPAAPDAPAGELGSDFVDLGDLKGNIGDQNYEIPDDVDLDRYSTVVIWCVRFSTAFGAAGLA